METRSSRSKTLTDTCWCSAKFCRSERRRGTVGWGFCGGGLAVSYSQIGTLRLNALLRALESSDDPQVVRRVDRPPWGFLWPACGTLQGYQLARSCQCDSGV